MKSIEEREAWACEAGKTSKEAPVRPRPWPMDGKKEAKGQRPNSTFTYGATGQSALGVV